MTLNGLYEFSVAPSPIHTILFFQIYKLTFNKCFWHGLYPPHFPPSQCHSVVEEAAGIDGWDGEMCSFLMWLV